MPTVKKVLVTSAIGPYVQLLDIARPSFERFARAQGYSLVIGTGLESGIRPPSWGKVPLLRRLVDSYEAVLWIDVDTVIMQSDRDPLLDMASSAFQAFVDYPTPLGNVPSCGFWLMRGGARSARFLDHVWEQEQFTGHPWWEQAAVASLLGRRFIDGQAQRDDPNQSISKFEDADQWVEGTGFLPSEWNAMMPGLHDRVRHYAGMPLADRRAQMKADAAQVRGRFLEARIRRTAFRLSKSVRYRLGA